MIDSPQITHCEEQLAAVIHVVVPRNEIQLVMGPGLHELMEGIAAQGIASTGPWFAHHLRMPTDTFDFEIGVPVASPVKAIGRIKPGKLPAATVARTVYSGPYERGCRAHGASLARGSRGKGAPPRRIFGSGMSCVPDRAPTQPTGGRSSIGR